MSSLRIGVVGERDAPDDLLAAAEEIGREVARRGGTVICGGMGGVMEAAARGSRAKVGTVVGILPGPTAEGGNAYVTIPIVTGMGEGRNIIVARTAEAIIAVGGAYGTLSEIAYALKLGVPVIGFRTWELRRMGLDADPIRRAATAQEAVDAAWTAVVERREDNGRAESNEYDPPRRREG